MASFLIAFALIGLGLAAAGVIADAIADIESRR